MSLIHVIDDDSAALAAMGEALSWRGHETVLYRGVAAYLDAAIARIPDAIVGDVLSLPVDGVEYMAALRCRDELASVPVVIVSPLAIREGVLVDHVLKQRFGVAALVQRPYASSVMLEAVERALTSNDRPRVTAARMSAEPAPVAAIPLRQIAAHPTAGSRAEPRFEASFEVSYSHQGASQTEHTLNVSRNGLFVRTSKPPARYATLELAVQIPGEGEPIALCGVVVHVVEAGVDHAAGFGVRVDLSGGAARARWQAVVKQVEQRSPSRVRGPKVFLLGFPGDRAAELARSAGLLCRQEISLVPLVSWQAALFEARRSDGKKKLVIVDVSAPPGDVRRESLFDARAMRELADVPNVSLAFVGLCAADEPNLPSELYVIRAAPLTTADLVGAVVNWLDLPVRAELRVPISCPARLELGTMRGEATLLDVSLSGARFLTAMPLEVGQAPTLSFRLPTGGDVERVPATVRWSKVAGRGLLMCGVTLDLSASSRAQVSLRGYIDQQAMLLRSLEGLRRRALGGGGVSEEPVRKIVPPDDEP